MLDRAESHLNRELDLRLFVRRQRFLVMSVLGLLSKRQRTFLARSSKLVLSSDSSTAEIARVNLNHLETLALDSSSGQEDEQFGPVVKNELSADVGAMVKRGNAVDKRLVNLFRLGVGDGGRLSKPQIIEQKDKKRPEELAGIDQFLNETPQPARINQFVEDSQETIKSIRRRDPDEFGLLIDESDLSIEP